MVTQERVPGTVAGGRWSGRGAFLGMPLLAVVLLVGCSGGSGDPGGSSTSVSSSVSSARSSPSSASPTTTSSSSSSAAYVPVKPTFPAAAKKHTDAGAVAFVTYFLELVNYSWTRPQAGLLGPLGTSTCVSCKNLEGTSVDLVASGERFESELFGSTAVRHVVTTDEVQVISTVAQRDVARLNTLGEVTGTQPAGATVRSFVVRWVASEWRIEEIGS